MSPVLPENIDDLGIPTASVALVGLRPITVRRRVTFGECDPARIVYTPVFAEYMVCAFEWTMLALLRGEKIADGTVVTPMRGLELDFRRMLSFGDWFDMRCHIAEVRTRTFDLRVNGMNAKGQVAFHGRLTPIAIDPLTRGSVPLPAEFAQVLTRYRELCPLPADGAA